MTQCVRTNSVFPPCEDEEKKYKSIVASGPLSYSPKVKIHDWQLRLQVEPRDNKTGNFRRSTYNRLGMDDEPMGISVTRAMTEQINEKTDYDVEYRYRSLLNFYSFPLTETDDYEKSLELTDLTLSKAIEPTDYRTTLTHDYPSHFPTMSPYRPPEIPDKPWLVYRRTLGYNSDDLERLSGVRTFLDDDMEIQNRAAALKMQRYVSYDPILKKYTDAEKFSEAICKKSSMNSST